MKAPAITLALLLSATFAVAQETTPMLTLANKLQADVQKGLPGSSLTVDENTEINADTAQLVTNATIRSKGGSPDRKAGQAAGMDIGRKASKFQSEDAAKIKQDLKDLQAAARK